MRRSISLLSALAGVTLLAGRAAPGAVTADAGAPFGDLPLVDLIDCAGSDGAHDFTEHPEGGSRVETVLGKRCRLLPPANEARYFAYRVGRGKGLKAGACYLLEVEYPEDRPRTIFIVNRGCETARGFATGQCLGDVLYTHTDNNVESLKLPLSGEYRTWQMLFYLHDRFSGVKAARGAGKRPDGPADGFRVIIAQSKQLNAPLSAGAAVSRIRLFRVPRPGDLAVKLRRPPEDLPRRHVFWREEMADGVLAGEEPGVGSDTDWYEYKARLMGFLGVDTFCKDLLEFGHNQGWDCGGWSWYNPSKTPKRWERILAMLGRHDLDVLPYYEYCGSVGPQGIGPQKRCVTLGGRKTYTHIKWSEKYNADVTDPDTLADAKRLLDATIVRHRSKVRFLGAWFRTRPSHMPVSFSDRCLKLFAANAAKDAAPTRDELMKNDALRASYYDWWYGKRREFLVGLRDHLRGKAVPGAAVLFTASAAEPGPSVGGWGGKVVTDDVELWKRLLSAPGHKKRSAVGYAPTVAAGEHLKACLRLPPTWGQWEWQHSAPPPDPARYRKTPGVVMTYPFNRAYTVASREAFDAFRGPGGLAVIRHYPLNENTMDSKLGYFVSDVERAGPYCMLAEARAVARGDPRYIGYLSSSSFNRGFPEHVRRFNAAFLALPALPSRLLPGASGDPGIVVREIRTERHGTWLAVVNTGLGKKKDVAIGLPAAAVRGGRVTDAATGEAVQTRRGALTLTLGPCELRSFHIAPAKGGGR